MGNLVTNDRKCICRKSVVLFQKQLVPTNANLAPDFLSAIF